MKPPTKFELMRKNAALRKHIAWRQSLDAPTKAGAGYEPAAPHQDAATMTLNGERFAEAPACDAEWQDCDGCAFLDRSDDECEQATVLATAVFGGSCSARRVIYIKAA